MREPKDFLEALTARVLALPRPIKRAIVAFADALVCVASVPLALFLRLGYFPDLTIEIALVAGLAAIVTIPTFYAFGLYREIFRYSGGAAMTAVARAMVVAAAPIFLLVTVIGVQNVPRTVGIIEPILVLLMVRFTRRFGRDVLGGSNRLGSRRKRGSSRVVIYGAGAAGRQLCSALTMGAERKVFAYIDDDLAKQGHRIDGLTVHPPEGVSDLIHRYAIEEVLLAIPSVSRARRNDIIASMRDLAVRVQTLPGMSDLASGRVQISDLRELGIEDLLGREAIPPDDHLLAKSVAGKTVLVTGAGGSIGGEICRQVLKSLPKTLLLVEANEYALYSIHNELNALAVEQRPVLVPLLASVLDERRLHEIMSAWHPDTIYHAAAYKHVPLVEHNIIEGIRNNALGTLCAATVAAEHGVTDFVLVSTDKAVRPTNVMGASKRLAELVLQALAREQVATCFTMVRFGNVLGSSGSVVPLFRRQIAAGGPVTVTHREMTRYFMTIPEAAQLVIQAGAMGTGGEVFVLDMGSPVRILELARNMIRLSGLMERDEANPDGDIAITFVGLRPGEKLYEELLIGDNPEPTGHPRILKANEKMLPWNVLRAGLDSLLEAFGEGDAVGARDKLLELVPEFRPDEDMVDFVYREQQMMAHLQSPPKVVAN